MRINILDPGLVAVAGHHLEMDRTLARELASRGHAVCVVANLGCDDRVRDRFADGIRFERRFRPSPYEVGTGRLRFAGRFAGYRYAAHLIAADLREVPAADLWIWPTLFAHDLRACAAARAAVPISGVIHRLGLPGMWPATARMAWRDAALLARRRGLVVRRIGPIEEALLADLTRPLSGFEPKVLPVPLEATGPVQQRRALGTVGFFGHQKDPYRRSTVAALAGACIDIGLDVMVQDSAEQRVDQPQSGVRYFGYVDDLNALVQEADLIVLPYDREIYRNALSGIGSIGIACGVPVLAPDGTSIADTLARYDTGLAYSDLTATAILAAINAIRDEYAAFADRAGRAAERWALANGVARHANALLGA